MYAIGDRIVHPLHGAGLVEKIVRQKTGGVLRDYYAVNLPGNGMTMMIPVDAAERIGMRPVMSAGEADRVLALFSEKEQHITANWSLRYKENLNRIKSGNPDEVARVIRILTRCDYEKGLSGGERKMLNNARLILISEIALAKDMPFQEIDAQITDIMQKNYFIPEK